MKTFRLFKTAILYLILFIAMLPSTVIPTPDFISANNLFDFCYAVRTAMGIATRNGTQGPDLNNRWSGDAYESGRLQEINASCYKLNKFGENFRQQYQKNSQKTADEQSQTANQNIPSFEFISPEKYDEETVNAYFDKMNGGRFSQNKPKEHTMDARIKALTMLQNCTSDSSMIQNCLQILWLISREKNRTLPVKYTGSQDPVKAIRESYEFLWKYRTDWPWH